MMFDATKILGGLLEGRSATSMSDRVGLAMQQQSQGGLLQQVLSQLGGSASGGGLGAVLGNLSARTADQGSSTGSGGLFDQITDMARRAAASPGSELAQNNPAAVGGLGALAGALLGGGRGAVGGGLMAVLGSLAYSAFQNAAANSSGGPAASPNQTSVVPPKYGSLADLPGYSDTVEVQRKARLMFRAMAQAAKADGTIDDTEAKRLTSHLDDAGEGPDARSFVMDEMRRPVDIAGLAGAVTSQAEAAEVYAASIMAIEPDTKAERDYLTALATALNLPGAVVAQIHASLNVKI